MVVLLNISDRFISQRDFKQFMLFLLTNLLLHKLIRASHYQKNFRTTYEISAKYIGIYDNDANHNEGTYIHTNHNKLTIIVPGSAAS